MSMPAHRMNIPAPRPALLGPLAALLAAMATSIAAEPLAPWAARSLVQADPNVIWCHDEARSIVRQIPERSCEGTVVSAEEAERIRAERVERIQRVLERDERGPVVPGRRLTGTGTGFFVSPNGHALTSHHVVDGCDGVTVTPAGGEAIVATVLASEPGRDLALLDTRYATPGAARLRSFDELVPNEPVTIIGYPLRGRVVIRPIPVTGQVHDEHDPGNPHVFAMRIDVRSGNSGGPVLDDAARVIGVVFAKIDTPAVYAKTGERVRNVGFGLRLPVVRDFLRRHAIDFADSDAGAPLEAEARYTRAREFIAQIGCWR
jgi:serine protease Do